MTDTRAEALLPVHSDTTSLRPHALRKAEIQRLAIARWAEIGAQRGSRRIVTPSR